MRQGWRALGLGLLLGVGGFGVAHAGTCTLSNNPLSFGAYNPLTSFSNTASSQVQLSCQATTPIDNQTGVVATIALTAGTSGNATRRTLVAGTDALQYNVYLDPTLQHIFGNGVDGTQSVTSCLAGGPCASTTESTTVVYGAIPPGQDVVPGPHQDNLVLQVTF
jgi:spore coat protein U-like protein